MRLGLYGSPEQAAPSALARGAVDLGFSLQWREGARFTPDQVEAFDLVVVCGGLRGPLGAIQRTYAAAGVPVLVLDTGFLRRGTYFQLGVGRLNWVPPGPLPADRFEALGLRLTVEGPTGGYILLCGQVPEDSAHGLSRAALERYFAQAAWIVAQRAAGRTRIVYRPHPEDHGWQHISGPIQDVANPSLATLDLCLRDAVAVVTYNSNVGHEALLAGIPVFCALGVGAAYEELAEHDLSTLATGRPKPPSPLRRQEYFNRLAYGQWTAGELETGEPLRFLRDRGLIPGG